MKQPKPAAPEALRESRAGREEARLPAEGGLQAAADASARVGQLRAWQGLAGAVAQRKVTVGATVWDRQKVLSLGLDSMASETLGDWTEDEKPRVFADVAQALDEADRVAAKKQPRVAQVWANKEARFQTHNTENDKGNSTYHAYPGGLDRYAPVNSGEGRPAEQVDNRQPGRMICYVDGGAVAKIMAQVDDGNFRVEGVAGGGGTIGILNDETGEWETVAVALTPAIGLAPLDFDYVPTTGEMRGIHIGHKVVKVL